MGGPTLKMKDLEKNGLLVDKDKLYQLIALGYKRMPGFSADCTRSKVRFIACMFGGWTPCTHCVRSFEVWVITA